MSYLAKDVFVTAATAINLVGRVTEEVEAMCDLDRLASRDCLVRDTKDDGFSCSFHPDIEAIAAEEGADALTQQIGEWLFDGKFVIPGLSKERNDEVVESCVELAVTFLDVDFEAIASKRAQIERDKNSSIGMTKL